MKLGSSGKFTYSERLNKIVIARSAATRQSHEIHLVRNDTLFNVNLFESFNINLEETGKG